MKPFTIEEYQQFELNEDRLNKCYKEKWFKLFVPIAYNGLELSMVDGCRELLKIATLQGGLGWTVNLGAGANWFSGFFEDEVASKIFSPEKAVVAGSGFTNGVWKSTDDGYEITGEWSKCTGAHHATLFSLSANHSLEGSKLFVVPREKVKLSNDKWPIMGMRNSSSFGIILDHVKVPKGYDFQMNVVKNNSHYSVLHIPFSSFARLCMSASYLGVVKCLMHYCLDELSKPLALEIIENQLRPLVLKSEQELYALADQIEVSCSKQVYTALDEQKMHQTLGENNMKVFHEVQRLFLAGGLSFIEEDKIIHWAYRDVLTAAQHFMVKP